MKHLARGSMAAWLLVSAAPAAQAANLLAAPRTLCVPVSVTDCKSANECTTRAATERDKAMPMVIDFALKKAFTRENDKDEAIGPVLDDRIESGLRRFAIREGDPARPPSLSLTLAPDGRLLGAARRGTHKFEAACTALR